MAFGADSTTDEVVEGIDLHGARVLVTGATGGLGFETARALASVGANVTLSGRDPTKLADAASRIAASEPGVDVDTVLMDLADLASVAAAVDTAAAGAAIDVLVANAGVMMCPEARTADGFEMQFGTNHLGHFALVARLGDALATDARVVVVSSAAHLRGTVDLDDLNWQTRPYDKMAAYAHSKTANIWFASELQRRRPAWTVNSLHPGVIMTDLARHLTASDLEEMAASGPLTLKTVAQGAATSVYAATSAEMTEAKGCYLADCRVAPPIDEVDDPMTGFAPWAYDESGAAELWTRSADLTGCDLA